MTRSHERGRFQSDGWRPQPPDSLLLQATEEFIMDRSKLDAFLQDYWSEAISIPEFLDRMQLLSQEECSYVSDCIIERSKQMLVGV